MKKISQVVFLIGVLVFMIGFFGFLFNLSNKNNLHKNSFIKTSLTERDLAIADAIKNNKKEYSYESNFTPGVGRINNPEKVLNSPNTNSSSEQITKNIENWQDILQNGLLKIKK